MAKSHANKNSVNASRHICIGLCVYITFYSVALDFMLIETYSFPVAIL